MTHDIPIKETVYVTTTTTVPADPAHPSDRTERTVDESSTVTVHYEPGTIVRALGFASSAYVGKLFELSTRTTKNGRDLYEGVKLTKDGKRRIGYMPHLLGRIPGEHFEVVEVGRQLERSRS